MTEIILALIVAGLLGGLIYERREHSKQVKELTTKLMAKNLSELTITEAKKPLSLEQLKKTSAAKDDDLVDIEELTDEEAAKAAEKTAANLRKGKK
jgi:hypothetical protein